MWFYSRSWLVGWRQGCGIWEAAHGRECGRPTRRCSAALVVGEQSAVRYCWDSIHSSFTHSIPCESTRIVWCNVQHSVMCIITCSDITQQLFRLFLFLSLVCLFRVHSRSRPFPSPLCCLSIALYLFIASSNPRPPVRFRWPEPSRAPLSPPSFTQSILPNLASWSSDLFAALPLLAILPSMPGTSLDAPGSWLRPLCSTTNIKWLKWNTNLIHATIAFCFQFKFTFYCSLALNVCFFFSLASFRKSRLWSLYPSLFLSLSLSSARVRWCAAYISSISVVIVASVFQHFSLRLPVFRGCCRFFSPVSHSFESCNLKSFIINTQWLFQMGTCSQATP